MPNGVIPRYALQGRVVTMDGNFKVLDAGAVYIDGNRIQEVRPAAEAKPVGFENARVIQTNGTIYPGLIELHNHLSYDILSLWDVPKTFSRRSQWADHPEKMRLITAPMQVLGHSRGFPEAIARYVEAKCLLAGVTTSQGIKLSGVGIEKFFKGIVRNVEQPVDPALPKANTRIPDVDAQDLQAFFNRLQNSTCILLHLCEGVDDRSRKTFEDLRFSDGTWAISAALGGIHCVALRQEDFRILKRRGASIIWSPLSNLLLYSKTLDLKAAKASKVRIALGSDWSPSGSKNLLGELKAAYLLSQHLYEEPIFTPRELVEMVTTKPAGILQWQDSLGSVETNKLADLIVLDGDQADPYEELIKATEKSIQLVVIDGVPRYGRRRLMSPFGPGTETIEVGGNVRTLNLHDEASNLEIQGLTLKAAGERLRDGLGRLDELARQLESDHAMGAALGIDSRPEQAFPTLDLDEDDMQTEALRLLLARDQIQDLQELRQLLDSIQYSELLQNVVIELDPLTVVDDEEYFGKIAGQVNLNNLTFDFKKRLADLYGKELDLPNGGDFVRRMFPCVRSQFWSVTDLHTFLATPGLLSWKERRLIVEQALILLERIYVHLPFKRAMYAVDPLQRLRLLLNSLELKEASEWNERPEIEFHREMTSIFTSLRDLHTNYLLPTPYRGKVAFLPFLIEEYFEGPKDQPERKYLVSKIFRGKDLKTFLVGGVNSRTFVEGVEVLHWNGIPIKRAIELNGELQAGGNLDARMARGLESLTIRPLSRSLPPDEEWVSLGYLDKDGKKREIRHKWLVFSLMEWVNGADADDQSLSATALGLDLKADAINQTKKLLFAADVVEEEHKISLTKIMPAMQHPATKQDLVPTSMPDVFRAIAKPNNRPDFGYIRIFTFNVKYHLEFIAEFVRLAEKLQDQAKNWKGLILDVRNNSGGLIYAAEGLLQTLTDKDIQPQPAQFIYTPLILELCRLYGNPENSSEIQLNSWIKSLGQAVRTGDTYSLGFPITPEETLQSIRDTYPKRIGGAKVLITDALCYSATDIFAAGFQDHGIGKILGTSNNTGAGGANVWTHTLLGALLKPLAGGSPIQPLPLRAGMRVAVRRTLRVGNQAGVPVEDLGIDPDCEPYLLKRDDLLHGNKGLIQAACDILAQS